MTDKLNTPWEAVEEDDAMWILDSEGYYVFEQPSSKEVHMAAAAPDLYKACCPDLIESIAKDIESEYGNNSLVQDLRYYADAQREAMVKAEGDN